MSEKTADQKAAEMIDAFRPLAEAAQAVLDRPDANFVRQLIDALKEQTTLGVALMVALADREIDITEFPELDRFRLCGGRASAVIAKYESESKFFIDHEDVATVEVD